METGNLEILNFRGCSEKCAAKNSFYKNHATNIMKTLERPHLSNTIIVTLTMFFTMSLYYSMGLWFPELFDRFGKTEMDDQSIKNFCSLSKNYYLLNETMASFQRNHIQLGVLYT